MTILENLKTVVLIVCLISSTFLVTIPAQESSQPKKSSSDQSGQTAADNNPSLETVLRQMSSAKTFEDFAAKLTALMNIYPYHEFIDSNIYQMRRFTKDLNDAERLKTVLTQIVKETGGIPPELKAKRNRYFANTLYSHHIYSEAAELARQATSVSEADFIDYQIKQQKFAESLMRKVNPNYKSEPLDLVSIRFDVNGLRTECYNIMGKSFSMLGKYDESEKAFRDSFAIAQTKDAALGIARAADKNGNNDEANKFATIAVLTGNSTPEDMKYFSALYAKAHQGNTTGQEEYLDAEYRKTYYNPIKAEKYLSRSKQSNRTVLTEFFTGTGCLPCIPYDYSFEKVIDDYSPKDIVILVYHTNAPDWNPLSNFSANDRQKYYEARGVPTIFIDGKKLDQTDDESLDYHDPKRLQETFQSIDTRLKKEIEIPSNIKIKLKARLEKGEVKVLTDFDKLPGNSADYSLQIALIENHLSYSGENGLRFQFMVVRALAGDNDKRTFGFKVDLLKANKLDYIFNIDKIIAQNGDYYDIFKTEKEKQFADVNGGVVPEGLRVNFNYRKNQINPKNLSVVAFLQNDKTKEILQSTRVNLAAK